jgi:PAS domain S-box-containing protein
VHEVNSHAPRWLPLLAGGGVALIALMLWWALSVQEQTHIQRLVTTEATSIKNEIAAQMQARILALVDIARRWEKNGRLPQAEWEFEAELNLNHFPGYHAIAWADAWLSLRWAVPLKGPDAALELNWVFEEQRRKAWDAVRNRREVTVTRAVELNDKEKGVLVFVPIFRGQECAGVIVGIFRLQELLDAILHERVLPQYGIAVFDINTPLYRMPHATSAYEDAWQQTSIIDLYGTSWRLRVWPQAALLKSEVSSLPAVVLLAGLGMSVLLTLAVMFAQTARLQASAVVNVNEKLEQEIAERVRVEGEVRKLNDELEQRVTDRTAQLADVNADLEKEIVARARIEQLLRESEKRYRGLIENVSDGILSCTLDGVVTDVNWGLEMMLGWSRHDLVGHHYRKIATPATVTLCDERIRLAVAGERLPGLFETEIVRRDGGVVPVEIRARLRRDKDGQPIGVIATLRDIATRKALDRQRQEFLTMLTHDIKSPLAVVLGYADLLLDSVGNESKDQQEKDLRQLRDNVCTVFSLVENYLNVSRLEDGQLSLEKKPIEINQLLTQVGQQYEAEARHRSVALTFALQPDLPTLHGDALALARAVSNLVSNALKFTPPSGQVTVSSEWRNGEVVASIADTGPGIPPAEIPLLFEKYHRGTTSREVEGTGLGLFIAKALVEAHGGHIEVRTAPDRGANFSLVLPLPN